MDLLTKLLFGLPLEMYRSGNIVFMTLAAFNDTFTLSVTEAEYHKAEIGKHIPIEVMTIRVR